MTVSVGRIKKYIWERCSYEAWCLGLRKLVDPGDGIMEKNAGAFTLLKPNVRYWYADPVIRKIKGEYCVFFEAYDKWKDVGSIALSRLKSNGFGRPEVVIREPFHMSFPEVFEYKGDYYMIPETNKVSQLRFYKMGRRVTSWTLFKTVDTEYSFSDTVVCVEGDNILLLTTDKKPDNPYMNRLHAFCINNFLTDDELYLKEMDIVPCADYGYDRRNGGSILLCQDGKMIRVIQESESGFYGKKLSFRWIDKLDEKVYIEGITARSVGLDDIFYSLPAIHKPVGIHTYGRCDDYEVIDIKTESMSIAVALGNIKRRFARKED